MNRETKGLLVAAGYLAGALRKGDRREEKKRPRENGHNAPKAHGDRGAVLVDCNSGMQSA